MAYEYLLTQYLQVKEITNVTNIEQKINKLNGILKFIPSHISSSYLREDIRNPLFHQGNVPNLNFDDLHKNFKIYHELLIKIILKILDYKGKYLSIFDFEPHDISDFSYV